MLSRPMMRAQKNVGFIVGIMVLTGIWEVALAEVPAKPCSDEGQN
jgi:hypothetical protein